MLDMRALLTSVSPSARPVLRRGRILISVPSKQGGRGWFPTSPTVNRGRSSGVSAYYPLVSPVVMGEMSYLEQESLRVVLLNTKNHVLGVREIYKGSVNQAQVRISELFREPIRQNCTRLILVHNHPSGAPRSV